jgi:glycosyltransferase involved in cell wall biosynthesis
LDEKENAGKMKDNCNDRKLNIAYVCREFGPVTGGGIGTYIYNVCMAMVGRGHRVFLVTDCFNETNAHQLPQGITLIPVIATPEHRKNSFVSISHEYSYRIYDTLSDLLHKEKVDIAEFAEFGCEGFATIRAKKMLNQFRNTKLIVKLHTPSSLLFTINEDKRLEVDSCCNYAMEDYCVRNADMVTSPSLSLGEYFKKRVGRNDIVKCPYPMELPERATPRKFTVEQVRRVRFIGSVQIRKGIDTFVAAARLVLERDDGFFVSVSIDEMQGIVVVFPGFLHIVH